MKFWWDDPDLKGPDAQSSTFPMEQTPSTAHSFSTPYPLLVPKELWSFTLKHFAGSCWVVLGV